MKLVPVFVALIAATVAVAAPVSFEARDATPSFELNDIDHAAISYLVARGVFDEASLEIRRLSLPKVKPDKSVPKTKPDKGKSHNDGSSNDGSSGNNQSESSSNQPLKVTFHDPSGPVSHSRQKEVTKALKETISEQNSPVESFPFCDATLSKSGKNTAGTFSCFKTEAKKPEDFSFGGTFEF